MKKFLTLLGVFLGGSLTSLGVAYAILNVQDPFPDVNYNDYYGDSLMEMQSRNIISGYDNGNFGPNDSVTRAQLVTILDRYDASLFNQNYGSSSLEVLLLLCDAVDKETLATGYKQEVYEKYCETEVLL